MMNDLTELEKRTNIQETIYHSRRFLDKYLNKYNDFQIKLGTFGMLKYSEIFKTISRRKHAFKRQVQYCFN